MLPQGRNVLDSNVHGNCSRQPQMPMLRWPVSLEVDKVAARGNEAKVLTGGRNASTGTTAECCAGRGAELRRRTARAPPSRGRTDLQTARGTQWLCRLYRGRGRGRPATAHFGRGSRLCRGVRRGRRGMVPEMAGRVACRRRDAECSQCGCRNPRAISGVEQFPAGGRRSLLRPTSTAAAPNIPAWSRRCGRTRCSSGRWSARSCARP
jgi:hypothetical protein